MDTEDIVIREHVFLFLKTQGDFEVSPWNVFQILFAQKVRNAIWKTVESFCLDWLSDFCWAIGKDTFGGAQNDVPLKITTQFSKSQFYNSIDFHFKMDLFETV